MPLSFARRDRVVVVVVVVRDSRSSWEGLGRLPENVGKSQCHGPTPGVSEVD